MSRSLFIGANVLAFVPASEREEEPVAAPVDTAAIEREVRAELESEYTARLEREVAARTAEERAWFEQSLRKYMAGFDECITSLRRDIQLNVVDLSLRLAEVIVRHELPDRDMLHNLIVKSLEPVSDLQGACVRISSHDWALFGAEISSGDHLGVGSTVQFAEDPNLSAGDVIIESRNGIFDARLEERIKLLKESLNDRSGRSDKQQAEL
ncbi:MAG: hypothetical protein JXR25_04735 [Pontiellaceae bacterium]|nr:hypothetical protein [Pontiellaceae bacterium]MBN2784112.1 hypothetical protein [Pontiellaceae bacterium]